MSIEWELQIKPQIAGFAVIRMALSKRIISVSIHEDVVELELSYTAGEYKRQIPLLP